MTDSAAWMAEIPEGWRAERWTYVGARLAGDGKLRDHYLGPDGQYHAFAKAITNTGIVGAIYRVVTDDDSVKVAGPLGPLYEGRLEADAPHVLEWAAEDRADRTRAGIEARARREAKQPDALSETLAPIRDKYQKTIGRARRAALLAAIIEEITR